MIDRDLAATSIKDPNTLFRHPEELATNLYPDRDMAWERRMAFVSLRSQQRTFSAQPNYLPGDLYIDQVEDWMLANAATDVNVAFDGGNIRG